MTGRLRSGDPLRAIAACSVVLSHVIALPLLFEVRAGELAFRLDPGGTPVAAGLPAWVPDLAITLGSGVWVFFALSGLLLGRPVARALRDGGRLPSVRRYARNRVLRIVPAFWVTALLTLVAFGPGRDDVADVLAVLAFVQVWHPSELGDRLAQAWSLDVEMAFYLALPLLAIAALPLRGRPGLLLGAVAAVALASLAFRGWAAGRGVAGAPSGALLVSLPAVLVAFTPGLALALLEPRLRARRLGPVAWALLAVALLAAVARTDVADDRAVRQAVLLTVLGGGLVAAAVVREVSAGAPWRWLDARPLHWLGERSYSLFLVHLPILIGLLDLADAQGLGSRQAFALLLLAGVPLSVGAAWALHRWVERPFLERRASQA